MAMETLRPTPPTHLASIKRTFTKLLRLRRSSAADEDDASSTISAKLKLYDDELERKTKTKKKKKKKLPPLMAERDEAESLLAALFASVSAIKAAYARLQLAESPYDPDAIHAADRAVVAELVRLSNLKRSYRRDLPRPRPDPSAAEIEERRHLIATYEVTLRAMESEIELKDAEMGSLSSDLLGSEKLCGALEARLRHGRSISALDGLHLSGLNPSHFRTALRYTLRSIRSFAKSMATKMESAGWDLDAAAAAAADVRLRNPSHRALAFESFVCRVMFSGFHRRGFDLLRSEWDRARFFREFGEINSSTPNRALDERTSRSPLGQFYKAKYLGLVHPKMEASFSKGMDQREMMKSEFFAEFAEMARRVWLLHCLFFSFDREGECAEVGSIFRVRRGERFSEVYMESVAEEEDDDDGEGEEGRWPTVGFTVVPGFMIGRTVIQCKVYLQYRIGRL
ncbi:uncharacterized protein LOC109710247 [Ananas comosus]|uniref:Uncharacterized protein LOC109710247 n=1 Tax=Ananas comosus TaxID=4615 RepID=A0A6P5EXP0_ANACO|nr:uncharacterized protein LOC109710247 [Ananas comosus]